MPRPLSARLRSAAVAAAGALLLAPHAAAQEEENPFRAAPATPSVAFAVRVREHLRQGGVEHPTGRVAVWIGEGNRGPRVSLAGTNVPRALWEGVAPLVDEFAAARRETGALELSFHLERLPGAEPADPARLQREPVLCNGGRVANGMYRIAREHSRFDGTRLAAEVALGMLVDARGRPAVVENRLQGDPEFNRYLTALAYEMRFAPAVADGRRVFAWVEAPRGLEFFLIRR